MMVLSHCAIPLTMTMMMQTLIIALLASAMLLIANCHVAAQFLQLSLSSGGDNDIEKFSPNSNAIPGKSIINNANDKPKSRKISFGPNNATATSVIEVDILDCSNPDKLRKPTPIYNKSSKGKTVVTIPDNIKVTPDEAIARADGLRRETISILKTGYGTNWCDFWRKDPSQSPSYTRSRETDFTAAFISQTEGPPKIIGDTGSSFDLAGEKDIPPSWTKYIKKLCNPK